MGDETNQPDPNFFSALWQSYKFPILLASVSIFLIVLSISLLIRSYQAVEPIRFSASSENSAATGSATHFLTVDVEGAVLHPGLYTVPAGSRVGEAIAAAGGITQEGDSDKIAQTINLAAKLVDGAKLYIPQKSGSPVSGQQSQGDTPGIIGQTGVSVNSATSAQLDSLPGIGPVTAKKIIDNRPYQTIEELVNKKVLSPSLYDKLKDQLTL
ncbi:helix-hairpin-helix domain-containing protein [Candidatus Gottesmanbacteria bacterium]|nr:helix-hairpin-helix domain-containing protein [Candidatus Gottesmanbacteria bacterium]